MDPYLPHGSFILLIRTDCKVIGTQRTRLFLELLSILDQLDVTVFEPWNISLNRCYPSFRVFHSLQQLLFDISWFESELTLLMQIRYQITERRIHEMDWRKPKKEQGDKGENWHCCDVRDPQLTAILCSVLLSSPQSRKRQRNMLLLQLCCCCCSLPLCQTPLFDSIFCLEHLFIVAVTRYLASKQ